MDATTIKGESKMALKLTKEEISSLLDSLRVAYSNGCRTPGEFLNYLDGENGYYLLRAKEYERKARDSKKSHLMSRQLWNIASNCRKKARFSRRLHTKITKSRINGLYGQKGPFNV